MERRCGQYSVRCWVVGAMFPPSILEDRCVDLRRSMCRLLRIDDRCEIMLLHLLETLMV